MSIQVLDTPMAGPKVCMPAPAKALIIEVLQERMGESPPEDASIIKDVLALIRDAPECQKVRGKRGPNPYNDFVGSCIRERGLPMAECAAEWKRAKAGV